MSVQPTLIILAAGLGSRFGGNKQIESVGPSGETLMDYSIYDAIKAGFGKVVFVIKESFNDDFKATFNEKRFKNLIKVEYVFQSTDNLPEGFVCPSERSKPWGTNHALMMAQDVVNEPFATVNADDFYGRDAFNKIVGFFNSTIGEENHYCMIGYDILKTLVKSGGTSRAECMIDKDNYLSFVEERTEVQSVNGIVKGFDMFKNPIEMKDNSIVSMNCWGFKPGYFIYSHQYFKEFLSININNHSSEFLIPSVVNDLIKKQKVKVKVLESNAEWFGLTYLKDKSFVHEKLMKLIKKGEYPLNLWL